MVTMFAWGAWYYWSRWSTITSVWGFSKKNLFFFSWPSHLRTLTCAQINRPQPPPFSALSRPSHPSPRPIFCCIGEQLQLPISPDSSPPCAPFDAPAVAKAPSKIPPWTTIRTLLPISSPVQHLDLHHHISCAPLALRSGQLKKKIFFLKSSDRGDCASTGSIIGSLLSLSS